MTSACSGPGATPNVRHLMLFDQVVRRGSVSAAARAAHLSQPAVTQAVARIEAALGARLLHRSYSGLELTGAGRAAAQRVERALEMLREALGAVRTRAGDAAYGDALRGITSTQLKALIAVVEEGAFARAARRAGRARTAVHRAARQLETSLGTELFEVTSFGVRPTREAEKLALRTRLASFSASRVGRTPKLVTSNNSVPRDVSSCRAARCTAVRARPARRAARAKAPSSTTAMSALSCVLVMPLRASAGAAFP